MLDREILAGELTKRDVAYLVFKRKYQLLGIFLGILGIVTIGAYIQPRSYIATATVYVVRNLPPIAAAGPTAMNYVLDRKEVLNSEVDLITSSAVAEGAADILLASQGDARRPARTPPTPLRQLRAAADTIRAALLAAGLTDPAPTPRAGLVAALQSAIEATPGINSDFITIKGTASDPAYAANMVNTMTQVYLDRRLLLFQRPGLEEFYENQIARMRSAMDDLTRQTETLKTSSGVVSQDEQLRLKLQELSGVNNELNAVQSEIQELGERITALRARVAEQPDTTLASRVLQRNPAIIELERRTVDLQAQKASELNRFSADSPVIQELDRSISRLQDAEARESATVVNTEQMAQNTVRTTLMTDLLRAESDYTAKQMRERALLDQIASLTQEVHAIDRNATELRQFEAESASAAKIYATYIEQREAARIAHETDPNVTNVKVIRAATPPAKPRFPRILLIAIGAVFGLLVAFSVAFVSELFSHTLNRREDVERELGLPVLAAIPVAPALRRPI